MTQKGHVALQAYSDGVQISTALDSDLRCILSCVVVQFFLIKPTFSKGIQSCRKEGPLTVACSQERDPDTGVDRPMKPGP